jgi:hypothetical protein
LCFGALVVQKSSATKPQSHQIFTKNSLTKRHWFLISNIIYKIAVGMDWVLYGFDDPVLTNQSKHCSRVGFNYNPAEDK